MEGVQIVVLEPYNGGLGTLSKLLGVHGPLFLPRPMRRDTVFGGVSFFFLTGKQYRHQAFSIGGQ